MQHTCLVFLQYNNWAVFDIVVMLLLNDTCNSSFKKNIFGLQSIGIYLFTGLIILIDFNFFTVFYTKSPLTFSLMNRRDLNRLTSCIECTTLPRKHLVFPELEKLYSPLARWHRRSGFFVFLSILHNVSGQSQIGCVFNRHSNSLLVLNTLCKVTQDRIRWKLW